MNSNETADKIFPIYFTKDGEMRTDRDLINIEGYKYTPGDKTPILSQSKKNDIKRFVRSLDDPIIKEWVDWEKIGNSDVRRISNFLTRKYDEAYNTLERQTYMTISDEQKETIGSYGLTDEYWKNIYRNKLGGHNKNKKKLKKLKTKKLKKLKKLKKNKKTKSRK